MSKFSEMRERIEPTVKETIDEMDIQGPPFNLACIFYMVSKLRPAIAA